MDRLERVAGARIAGALRVLFAFACAAIAVLWLSPARASTPFTISGSPAVTAKVGTRYTFTPTVSNPEKLSVFYRLWDAPSWLALNASTGQISGTPTAAGTFGKIELCVSDGATSACLPQYAITVSGSGTTTAAPTVSLTASPSSVSSGGSATLTWSASNATSCTASGGWSGSEGISGSKSTGAETANTTYTLSCTGPGGTSAKSTTVDVANATVVTTPAPSCSSTSGSLVLNAKVARSSGIAPLLVFFDATGTTDSKVTGGATPFQNVSYSWTFGDTNASGTGMWAYGSNAGHNSKNSATGAIAAHLYVTPGSDSSYVATVTAFDGTNRASCQLSVTAYDPSESHGFPGTKTTCVSASGKPVAGSAECPAGAAVLQTSSISSALGSAFGSGKRVLFKCGDTFSGGYTVAAGSSGWSIGAYGTCVNTSSGRPIFSIGSGGSSLTLNSSNTTAGPVDGRISDIDFEGHGSGLVAITTGGGFNVQQVTLYNLYANGLTSSYYMSGGTQNGIVQSVMTGMGAKEGTFWNYAQNNCLNGSRALNCGGTAAFANVAYSAVLGNDFNGAGAATSNSWETFRVSACRMCVFENNTFANASTGGGATFKLHSGNTYITQATWIGQYTEMVEIADNVFTGTSGAQLVENSPQNNVTDERLRNIVVERNLFSGTTAVGRDILVSAVNETVRDNVFYVASTGPQYGVQIAERGIEPVPQHVEFYNNTCYARTHMGSCAGFDGSSMSAPGINSWAENNLFYDGGTNTTTIVNDGSGNTVSNNTTNSSVNPEVANANGAYNMVADFAPAAAYSGAAAVPNYLDGIGASWTSYVLGALLP
jgi:Putative Ig domain